MPRLHEEVISKQMADLLKQICANPAFKDFYLAGGTALALQLGHRKSIDLDFFSPTEFSANLINKLGLEYQVINLNDNSIEVTVNGCKLMFMYFGYPLTNPIKEFEGLRLADPLDIGFMKLLALQGRSTKKDIIDLFFLDKNILPLEKLLKSFESVYPKESFNAYASLKSIINPEDFMGQANPLMLIETDSEIAYELVVNKVGAHLKGLLLSK